MKTTAFTGIKKTTVDLKKKLVTRQYDEALVSADRLREAIAAAGYEVAGTV